MPGVSRELVLDPAVDTWLADHCPTWTVPVVPMMSTVDLLAGAAADLTGQEVVWLSGVRLSRWLPVAGPIRLRVSAKQLGGCVAAALEVWRHASDPRLSRFDLVAEATVSVGRADMLAPPPPPPLTDAVEVPDPYGTGCLFHGPALAHVTRLWVGGNGASAVLDAGRGQVPRGTLHQGLLDALTHPIAHGRLSSRWVGADHIGFPHRIPVMRCHRPLPETGEMRCEVRFAGYDGTGLPTFDIELRQDDGTVLIDLRLVTAPLPLGPFAALPPHQVRQFLRDREHVDGTGYSRTEDGRTVLTAEELTTMDWPPGTVAAVYGLPPSARPVEHLARVTVMDHVARKAKVHPSRIETTDDLQQAWTADRADERHRVVVHRHDDRVVVTEG
ncbi:hypothetical protein [Lentzea roselyniae]|uniref:hypothetical protein n=1 Tax=Lentzea roselyniae TaxID=531940 RepID=UPI0031F872DD